MAEIILILGASGTGKTHSSKTCDPKKTVFINTDLKHLPWGGYKKAYNKENKNFVKTRDYDKIKNIMRDVDKNRPDVNLIIIDTLYYLVMNEFMDKAQIGGFNKFTEIGLHVWDLVHFARNLEREDLIVVMMSHTDTEDGKRILSAPGKLVSEKMKPQGLVVVVLESEIDYTGENASFKFSTQHLGDGLAKSPQGMFESRLIDNDLNYVLNRVRRYYDGDLEDKTETKNEEK